MSAKPLSVTDGFRRWAATYEEENPLTELDQIASRQLTPPPIRGALLEVGCGTGRRLPDTGQGPDTVVGLDLVLAMLSRHRPVPGRHLVAGTIEQLPFSDGHFDVIWCRLTIGFVRELRPALSSLARVLKKDGQLLITDLHPDMADQGAERGFRLDDGSWQVIESVVHPVEQLLATAGHAGLELTGRLDLTVDPEFADRYRSAGREDLYRVHSKQPLLLGLRFSR
jgi:ubiquinone/menaquinone biosynthesis C-methylase UbiE